jgi:hypothetical protein
MSKDSISENIAELFELYKSGAFTKEEYETLKARLLNTWNNEIEPEPSFYEQNQIHVPQEKIGVESSETKVDLHSSVTEPKIENPDTSLSEFDPSVQVKKRTSKRMVFAIISTVIVVVSIVLISLYINNGTIDKKINVETKTIIKDSVKPVESVGSVGIENSENYSAFVLMCINSYYSGINDKTFDATQYFSANITRYITMMNTTPIAINSYINDDFYKNFVDAHFEIEPESDTINKQADGSYSLKFIEMGNWFSPLTKLYHNTKSKVRVTLDNNYKMTFFQQYQLIKDSLSIEKPIIKESIDSEEYSTNDGNNYDCFKDDNITLDESLSLRAKFLEGVDQIEYSAYSNHKFSLDFDAPYIDNKRGAEPPNISTGYQRAYFINSEKVCLQRKLINNAVVEEITFHPNGKIYFVVDVINKKYDGKIKLVDLDNYVILEGTYDNGQKIGYWNTPVLGNLDIKDRNIMDQYPGIFNQIQTLLKFYNYDKDTRIFYMN